MSAGHFLVIITQSPPFGMPHLACVSRLVICLPLSDTGECTASLGHQVTECSTAASCTGEGSPEGIDLPVSGKGSSTARVKVCL